MYVVFYYFSGATGRASKIDQSMAIDGLATTGLGGSGGGEGCNMAWLWMVDEQVVSE